MENRRPPKPRRLRGTAANAFGTKFALGFLGVAAVIGVTIHFFGKNQLSSNLAKHGLYSTGIQRSPRKPFNSSSTIFDQPQQD
ncbi:hypothetical protein GHT06_012695 [Daphnia sinensis]|uniref:Uncharacterized protein n=1 Tax=Daphnia sinensis TaxID=1820382 RepID=A0AAD5PZ81_9CRUS|nr:hypothetical protein GHT06_012695 [Daphnia sinensis]